MARRQRARRAGARVLPRSRRSPPPAPGRAPRAHTSLPGARRLDGQRGAPGAGAEDRRCACHPIPPRSGSRPSPGPASPSPSRSSSAARMAPASCLEALGRVDDQQAAAVQPRAGRSARAATARRRPCRAARHRCSAAWKARTGARCLIGYQAAGRAARKRWQTSGDARRPGRSNSPSCSKGGSISTRPRFSGKGVSAPQRLPAVAVVDGDLARRGGSAARSAAWSSGCSSQAQQVVLRPQQARAIRAGEPG